MLIGLDPRRFTGIKMLNHHEPVFLHGLGEELFEFADQYEGIRYKSELTSTSNSSRSGQQ